jgi:hypothetical protein
MNKILSVLLIAASLTSTASFASNNCKDPIDTWQPQKNLQNMLAIKGWQVDQIKIDDGCYEVKGLDTLGNRFEAIFLPSTLRIAKLEIEFTTQGSAEDYLDKNANTY